LLIARRMHTSCRILPVLEIRPLHTRT
jgi:hypothetical protein